MERDHTEKKTCHTDDTLVNGDVVDHCVTDLHTENSHLESLALILTKYDLSEIEFEKNGCRIYMSKRLSHDVSAGNIPHAQLADTKLPTSSTKEMHGEVYQEVNWRTHPGVVLSPMVGVAYMSPEPGTEPFIHVGSSVSAGQTLLIIEAMKVLNPIKAHKSGNIIAILVSNKKPVEYNEPLVVIAE
ncbi:MAG: acetyl-CoA carboxylase, biotin carboxyl carrier protein [Holosporales bacterium]|jgi:acetyl-CoA carboxylase biotin carboxyl carrier protein|nr:acetyl-CoA carboxylase, biotin carboxyl carrier protein [Holosporales bacterium]